MRIVRCRYGLQVHAGILDGDVVHTFEGDLGAPVRGAPLATLDQVTLLAPCQPGQVISVGANYADRCVENGLAIPSAPALHDTFHMPGAGPVVGPDAVVRLPPWESHVEYGAELGVVIGRDGDRIGRAASVADLILGYTCLDNLWAKTRPRVAGDANIRVYDSFCPIGPWIETDLDPGDLALCLRVDGEIRQDARTSIMLFDVLSLVAFVAGHVLLRAGDVIMTGTPSGVRPVEDGQRIEVEIEGIGTLRHRVVRDPSVEQRPLTRMTA
jgi:2-keto-4-pentenoate hydratase/2-oxohepta-3-ene-1,7-dioic acid hydratase in catechol pathway